MILDNLLRKLPKSTPPVSAVSHLDRRYEALSNAVGSGTARYLRRNQGIRSDCILFEEFAYFKLPFLQKESDSQHVKFNLSI